jgi:CHAT domain-containing protein
VFVELNRPVDAAQTQVARVLALAMLGRYDEAAAVGRSALETFVSEGDDLAAGKIEMNLSNIAARREHHAEAEAFALSARERFMTTGERTWQTMAENDLANTYTEINDFERAERFYRMALDGARAKRMGVTEAEIEASLGNLARLQGRYSEALRQLEYSRGRYERLGMPHQSAIADLEIADIYSELNLLDEASAIYRKVSPVLNNLKMAAEEARSRLNHGRTRAAQGSAADAAAELRRALQLFEQEGNDAGRAAALLSLAEGELATDDVASARRTAGLARLAIERAENPRHHISLTLLEGELLCRTGDIAAAETSFRRALQLAADAGQRSAAVAAHTALGNIAARRGDHTGAAAEFKQAIKTIESMRSPLAAEFSMAFLASHLAPYERLTRLLIERRAVREAFEVVESGRSRALLDSLQRGAARRSCTGLEARLEELRAEVNILYKRLDTAGADERARLNRTVRQAEDEITALTRRIGSLSAAGSRTAKPAFSLQSIQHHLGDETVLVEFVVIDDLFSAFLVTGKRVDLVRLDATPAGVRQQLEELRFQFGSLRYGDDVLRRFGAQLKVRTDRCLARLYDLLLRPLERYLKTERVVIVPAGVLHYVPFHALHDATRYAAQRFEISYAPSAAVWAALSSKRRTTPGTSLLVAYADERIPQVYDEIARVEQAVPDPTVLTGDNAAYAAVMDEIDRRDIIHLACHGQFRGDNPMFSSLHLADGWVTVRDIVSRRLRARLVTLSACETGLSELFAGDELLGLARGFLSAGASGLIVSLWSVNDNATGRLMNSLYQHLQRRGTPAASLRAAQLGFIERGEHPFLWSPFIAIGR